MTKNINPVLKEFFVYKDELLEKQIPLIRKLNVFGFTGSTDIRQQGEHIFGRSYSPERYDDVRFRTAETAPLIRVWNNGLSFHAFLTLKNIFSDYIKTYDSLPPIKRPA